MKTKTTTPKTETAANPTLVEAMARKGYMPIALAAERSGYTTTHLSRMLVAGTLAGERVGARTTFIARASLAAFLGDVAANAVGLDLPLEGEEVAPRKAKRAST